MTTASKKRGGHELRHVVRTAWADEARYLVAALLLPLTVLGVLAAIADVALGFGTATAETTGTSASFFVNFGWISLVVGLATFVPGLTSQAARLHDRGLSAWWLLLHLLPVIGQLVLLILVGFLPGDEGANQYGPAPDTVAAPA